jgi:superoxide dismutase, Cu-Zn family
LSVVRWRRSLIVLVACLLASGVFASQVVLAQVPPVGATADVRDAAGRLVANAEFREGRGEVLITVLFPQPPALTGTHGLRIHEVGRCDPPDFLSAGNGFNPLGKKHGRNNPDGPQVGDLPNVNFTTGLTSYNTSAVGATLRAGATSLLGPNKTALIVYSGEDDQLTDPDGKAGGRLACGVINAAPGLALSPVAAQPALPPPTVTPVAGLRPPVQQAPPAVAAKPQPGLPKPVAAASPSPVVAQPALPKPAVGASPGSVPTPVLAVPTAPPPVAAQPTAQTNSGGPGTGITVLIAVLGVGLVGAGWLLRRRAQLRG